MIEILKALKQLHQLGFNHRNFSEEDVYYDWDTISDKVRNVRIAHYSESQPLKCQKKYLQRCTDLLPNYGWSDGSKYWDIWAFGLIVMSLYLGVKTVDRCKNYKDALKICEIKI